jgi:hypothetical protein
MGQFIRWNVDRVRLQTTTTDQGRSSTNNILRPNAVRSHGEQVHNLSEWLLVSHICLFQKVVNNEPGLHHPGTWRLK